MYIFLYIFFYFENSLQKNCLIYDFQPQFRAEIVNQKYVFQYFFQYYFVHPPHAFNMQLFQFQLPKPSRAIC